MAEYIDREKLLDELGESASHHAESGREYQLLLRDRNIVREQPTADVIERSKIDKAIEEIKQASFNHHFELGEYIGEQTEQWKIVKLDDVLEILKRNKGE